MSKENTKVVEGVVLDDETKKALLKQHRKKKLTPKDKKFINAWVKNGGNKTQAALEACDVTSYESAKSVGQYMGNKLQEQLESALMRYGLDDETAMTRHKELIESTNESVAMKAVDTWYKYRFKGDGSEKEQTVNVQINF